MYSLLGVKNISGESLRAASEINLFCSSGRTGGYLERHSVCVQIRRQRRRGAYSRAAGHGFCSVRFDGIEHVAASRRGIGDLAGRKGANVRIAGWYDERILGTEGSWGAACCGARRGRLDGDI